MPTRHRLPRSLCLACLLGSLSAAGLGIPVSAHAAPPNVHVGISIGVKLPHGAVRVDVGGKPYYYHRGVFYRKGPRGFVVVAPPRGAIVRTLPPHHKRVIIRGTVYYRAGDTYYRPTPGGFMVVEIADPPPTEAPATPPASHADPADFSVWLDGREYILRDGQFFQRSPEGLVWHEPPFGATASTLPAGAESIWFQDTEYFEVDGVFFRKTPDGYRLVAPPWESSRDNATATEDAENA
ncbi:MAG: hypothetical protein D6781_07225 [Verrucomicrobia bacterium]|nr:MAG: hypothetical protein D6781_07225 [Verrucomicrobiota bacterium]